MVRTALYLLTTFVVVVMLSDRAERPAVMAATGPEVSVRLTQAETDCIVGGQDGCLGVAVGSYKGCVESNFDPERPETATAFVECGAVGLWEGVLCAFSWLWDWLFA